MRSYISSYLKTYFSKRNKKCRVSSAFFVCLEYVFFEYGLSLYFYSAFLRLSSSSLALSQQEQPLHPSQPQSQVGSPFFFLIIRETTTPTTIATHAIMSTISKGYIQKPPFLLRSFRDFFYSKQRLRTLR